MEDIKSTAKHPASSVKHDLDSSIQSQGALGATPHMPAPAKPARSRLSRVIHMRKATLWKTLLVCLSTLGVGIAIYMFVIWKQTIPPPLPRDTLSSLSYPVYYPSHMPHGFHFMSSSIANNNGLFFYKFNAGKKIITVTQQAVPTKNIDLNKLEGYTSLKSTVGRAAVGQSVGNPSVIILTGSTLINITSKNDVTKDQVLSIAKSMELAERP